MDNGALPFASVAVATLRAAEIRAAFVPPASGTLRAKVNVGPNKAQSQFHGNHSQAFL